jgi:Rap guanine nucleotide exchange factor 1
LFLVFGEAFLLTFRTFISPAELIEKLIHRYNFFNNQNNDLKKRAAKEAFSLLVRVVNDLTSHEISTTVMESLIKFVFELIIGSELLLAKLLRVKVIEKTLMMRLKNSGGPAYLPERPIMSNPPSLIDLKSSDIGNYYKFIN